MDYGSVVNNQKCVCGKVHAAGIDDCISGKGVLAKLPEIIGRYNAKKGLPMHLYCADTEEDVQFCIEKGASLITANDPSALLKLLR